VVSESSTPRRPVLTLDDLATPLSRRPERLHALTAAELSTAFSQGLDLAEGKQAGHAQRVCYIASMLGEALGLDAEQRSAVFFGALLHDAGVTQAASDICRQAGVDEDAIFGPSPLKTPEQLRAELPFADMRAVNDAVHQHALLGAEIVQALDLPAEAAQAVAAHHERWDGQASPASLARCSRAGASPTPSASMRVRRLTRRSSRGCSTWRRATSSGLGCTPRT
jgi:putative nucleotidyltransferase with HDIG domain